MTTQIEMNNLASLVYDITKYLDEHPGGKYVMLELAGNDATTDFDYVGHSHDAYNTLAGFEVGSLAGYVSSHTR